MIQKICFDKTSLSSTTKTNVLFALLPIIALFLFNNHFLPACSPHVCFLSLLLWLARAQAALRSLEMYFRSVRRG